MVHKSEFDDSWRFADYRPRAEFEPGETIKGDPGELMAFVKNYQEKQCRKDCNCHSCNVEREANVATEAIGLVEGHRQKDYGHPATDLGRTAKLWTAMFDHEFTAEDVATALRMVKESRLRNSPRHRDSLVDIIGYALTQEMIWEAKK